MAILDQLVRGKGGGVWDLGMVAVGLGGCRAYLHGNMSIILPESSDPYILNYVHNFVQNSLEIRPPPLLVSWHC